MRASGWLTASLLITAACGDIPTTPSQTADGVQLSDLAMSEVREAQGGRRQRGAEDELLRIEAEVPGFAGMFWDADRRRMVALAKRGTDQTLVRTALRQRAARSELVDEIRSALRVDDDVEVREVDYSMSELIAAQKLFMAQMNHAEAVGVDADEQVNRLVVYVSDASRGERIREIGRRARLPEGMIEIRQGGPIEATANLRDRVRALGGGLQIKNTWGGACTMGFIVDVYAYGTRGFLTAAHCEPQTAANIGDGTTGRFSFQSQATLLDQVGAVQLNPAWTRTDPECASNPLCTLADVMFAQRTIVSQANMPRRVLGNVTFGANNATGPIGINASWSGFTPAIAFVGQSMDKVGRTTGGTTGLVSATCMSVDVGAVYYIGGIPIPVTYRVICANEVQNASAGPADSGSPVFTRPGFVGDTPRAHGILFAYGGTRYEGEPCFDQCRYYYSGWYEIESHLSRYFLP